MAKRRLSIEQKKMQLSTATLKLGAVGYAEWRPAMRAALVVQRAWAVVRVLSMTINCFSGTFPEVPGSTPSGASPF